MVSPIHLRINNHYSRLLIFIFFIFSFNLLASPRITVSVNPNRSTNGESVLFKIDVQVDSSARIGSPSLHNLKDWELVNSFKSSGSRVSYVNGKTQYLFQSEFSFILRPLKVGSVNIPPVDVDVDGKTYKTDPLSVQVLQLPGGASSRDRSAQAQRPLPNPRAPRLPPGGSSLSPSMPTPPNVPTSPNIVPPPNESFFVRPEIKTTTPWVGQLVEVAYVLYQRTRNLRNFEMAKFPDFKGFLKEELFIAKNFSQERVQIGDEVLLRSDIIRYAIFPIKTGEISIAPFEVRAEVFTSPDDLINSIIMGSPPPSMRAPIPMTKSSGSIKLDVKELPPTPPESQFTGAVGQFDLELKGPTGKLEVDQPFTVQLTLAGKGNVKMIEEATLPLPKEFELFQTKNSSEVRPDASGYKTFEYLILPRAAGEFHVPSFKWSFFDPDLGTYESIQTQALSFSIEGGSGTSRKDIPQMQKQEPALSSFEVVAAPLTKTQKSSSLPLGFASVLALLYAGLGWFWVQRKQEEATSSHLRNNPWEKTALLIRQKNYKGPVGLCILVDQWTREYLSGNLPASDLHSESPRHEFEKIIRERTPAEFQKQIPDLTKFWNDLDLARFAGSKQWPIDTKPDFLFSKAEEVCKKIIQRCLSLSELARLRDVDDDE